MKHYSKYSQFTKKVIFISALLAGFSLSGCKKDKAQSSSFANKKPQIDYSSLVIKNSSQENYQANLNNMMNSFFTLDYSAEVPDMPVSKEEAKKDSKKAKKDGKQTTSFIPGIKKLSEYVTKYSTKRKQIPQYAASTKTEKEPDNLSETVFEIEEWGPRGSIVTESENPTFYVIFSQPVRSLQALPQPSSTSDVMQITPSLKGTFHWYGTQHISFEAEETPDPSTVYTISIDKDIKSIYGNTLEGAYSFQTQAEPVEIKNIYGGYIKEILQAYDNTTGALPPYENRFYVRTNYLLKAEGLKNNLDILIDQTPVSKSNITVEADFTNKGFSWWQNEPECNKEKQTSNSFIITINSEVPHNSTVKVKSKDEKNYHSYKTLQPLKIVNFPDYAQYSDGNIGNPIKIIFSQTPDLDSVLQNIYCIPADELGPTFDPNKGTVYKLTKDNVIINGRYLTIHSLPLELDSSYVMLIRGYLKDIYGQSFKSNDTYYTYNFKTKPVIAYVNYLDYGTKMMEAQYPHKLIFEYQNIEADSTYSIKKVNNPLFIGKDNTYTQLITTPLGQKDTRTFQEIELDPYLDDGFGFVRFDANTKLYAFNYWNDGPELEDDDDVIALQVTDLGITARLGINKAVVMVRSLSTNKPVPNADVYILNNLSNKTVEEDPLKNVIASGKTNENGLAVINYTMDEIYTYLDFIKSNYYNDTQIVFVKKDNDKAMYLPNSHNSYRDGVYTSSRYRALDSFKRTFMFVDRGIYRPGETVTFRGIDREQIFGELIPYSGGYNIKVTGSWYNSEEIITPITGTVSESGGFSGSFKLDDNLEPGYYRLKYFRENAEDEYDYSYITFQVAEFERVKTTAALTVPEITYYNGDTLSASLSAEYLAGGVLSGAEYNVTWYKQAAFVDFETPETKGYSFGPSIYSSRTYYSDDIGKLSGDGTANLICKSEKITDGSPYSYRVVAEVTDISNQRISTQNTVTVHPSQFYVGLKTANSHSGFAKTKEKISFPYILTDVSGNLLEKPEQKVSNIEYTLSREEWTLIHEQSVDNTIYTRYEREDIEELKGSIEVKTSGNLEITPQNSGWYTLNINGFDNKGNKTTTTYEFYVTGGSSYRYNNYNSEAITLTPDQSEYNPGDTAQILLESPLPQGDYLITVEREGIFTEEIKHFDSPSNVIEVPIASNFVPVVYVSVSSYSVRNGEPTHQYGEPDLDKPKGYYGVTAVFVNPYVRAFSISVETDKPTYRPGEQATINLHATKGGKPLSNAELTVMAVDRGVLDLIDYHVQNPISFFYDFYNFPLRVFGGDSRALLMDPVTYSIKDLQGGDSDEEKEDERKDFRPTALFEPVITTDKNGDATVTFTVPDSLTTYRITAFGVKENLFALQEEEFAVQNPVNVQQVQPRKLRERDTAECGVLITNLDASGHEITVSLETRTPSGNTMQDELEGRITVPGAAFVDGEFKHTVYVASGESSVVYFNVGAKQAGTVELIYSIESDILTEKLNSPIKIEKTYVYETVTTIGTIDDDKKNSKAVEQIAIPGFAKDGMGELTFTVDPTRLGLLGGAVNYLFEYPYGCIEQQSSQVLPLVVFGDYIDVFDLNSKVANPKKCVLSFTNNWSRYQKDDGGFPYWPSGNYSDLYVSIRVAAIYALGLKHGYTEKDFDFNISKLLDYIYQTITSSSYSDTCYDYLKAYASYIFAILDDTRMTSTMNVLSNRTDKLNLSTEAMLGLAYLEQKSITYAQVLTDDIRKYLQPDARTVTVLRKSRANLWDWYNSDSEQLAKILQLFVSINPDDKMVDRLVYTLMQDQKHGYWQNTASTASVLEAIYTYIKARNLDDTDYKATISLENKDILTESFKGVNAKPKTLKLSFDDSLISALPKDSPQSVTFAKKGSGNLYYTLEMKYALPDEILQGRNEGFKIDLQIIDSESGEVVNTPKTDDDATLTLESGKIYKALIKIESNKSHDFVALRAPIPSGAEILDSSLVTTGILNEESNNSYGHYLSNKTIRDNEIQFFWDKFTSGSTTVNFTFRAARRGIYPLPPVQAECMYESETFGRSDGYLSIIQ